MAIEFLKKLLEFVTAEIVNPEPSKLAEFWFITLLASECVERKVKEIDLVARMFAKDYKE